LGAHSVKSTLAAADRDRRAGPDWPPVVVASVFQTGLNLMRDLIRRGVRAVGVDYESHNSGFRSVYGHSYLCPNPDTHPQEWLAFMQSLSRQMGIRPVIICAADIFVSALGAHADALEPYYVFSRASVAVQAALATKEQQYALAQQHGLPCPRTVYIESAEQLRDFAGLARFPCLLKPRHQREWEALPEGNRLRGKKLVTGDSVEQLLEFYALAEPYRPQVMAQEIIAGPDSEKYCYLSVYASDGSLLGCSVVREYRCNPILFGSASVVEPVVDHEIATLCDTFLRKVDYAGLCEIELKRDARDSQVKLIEVNPRFSVTGDCASYTGVEVGWLHYLDLIGKRPVRMEPTRFDFLHMVLRREVAAVPVYLDNRLVSWSELMRSYRRRLEFFDVDWRDWRVTAETLYACMKIMAVYVLRKLGLKPPAPK
jgi:predicted ATP-grasp superfamily ATP-dependent carboligase